MQVTLLDGLSKELEPWLVNLYVNPVLLILKLLLRLLQEQELSLQIFELFREEHVHFTAQLLCCHDLLDKVDNERIVEVHLDFQIVQIKWLGNESETFFESHLSGLLSD